MKANARIFRADAFTPEAVIAAGIPASVAHAAIVDGPRATPQRALISAEPGKSKRTEPTRRYVWGPDLAFLAGVK